MALRGQLLHGLLQQLSERHHLWLAQQEFQERVQTHSHLGVGDPALCDRDVARRHGRPQHEEQAVAAAATQQQRVGARSHKQRMSPDSFVCVQW